MHIARPETTLDIREGPDRCQRCKHQFVGGARLFMVVEKVIWACYTAFNLYQPEWVPVCAECLSADEQKWSWRERDCRGCERQMSIPSSRSSLPYEKRAIPCVCSSRCYQRIRRKERREWLRYPCKMCGKAFKPARADARYCSSACRQWAYRRRKSE